MKLSIIVPVYRVEATLDRCVESIRCQFDDGWTGEWELLLVDDGSPDNCPALCDKWAENDAHIRALHKENGGLSDARNFGIRHATGDYITFVDSDDALNPGTLQPLMRLLADNEDCDVLEYPVLVHAGHASEKLLSLPDRKWNSVRQYWHEAETWEHTYAWNKIFRASLFVKVIFPKGRIFEDAWFYPQLLSHHPKVMTTSKGLYRYIWNDDGITVNATNGELRQLLHSQMRAAFLMRTTPFSPNGKKLYRSMACRLYDIINLRTR